MLSLQPTSHWGHATVSPDVRTFDVIGVTGISVWISHRWGHWRIGWSITGTFASAEWTGEYATAHEAFAVLQDAYYRDGRTSRSDRVRVLLLGV